MGSYCHFFVVVQDERAFQRHLSSTTKAIWLWSGQLHLINYLLGHFSRPYTHVHTHTRMYTDGIHNCSFLNEAFKTGFSVVLCLNQLSTRSKL